MASTFLTLPTSMAGKKAHALDIHLAQEALDQLDHIFLGPGGLAPEAYAW